MRSCAVKLVRGWLWLAFMTSAWLAAPEVQAQAGVVTGTVVDAKTGRPIPDAAVQVDGTQIRVRTGVRGDFRVGGITTPSVTLLVTRVGYQAAQVNATPGGPPVRVEINEYAVKLDELVVTGAVGDTRARTLGNAIGKVDVARTVELAPPAKLQDVLSVNIPGVRVMRASGGVGSGGITRIRGAGSLSLGNEPLIFVDGVRVNNSASVNSEAFSGAQESPSRINDFNPEEIESIEVLKGPSAATIYGTEASNGVIQITTKRGRAGRPVFDVRMEAGANWLSNPNGRYPSNYYFSPTAQEVREFDVLQFNEDRGFGSPFSNGHPWALGASLNGGTESVRYHLSADYARDEGAVDYNWQNKFSTRANIGYSSSKFTVDASVGALRSKLRGASAVQPITTSVLWACNFPGCEPTGPDTTTTGWNDEGHGYQFYRPEDYDGVEGYDNIDRTTLSVRLTHTPVSWFRHNLTVGPDFTNNKSTQLVNRYPTDRRPFFAQSEGQKTARQLRSTFLTVDYGAAADLKVSDRLTFTTSAGTQYYHKEFDESFAQGLVFAIPGPSDVTGATNRTGAEAFQENKTLGFYVQEQLNWRDRLFVTGAVRADDNSAFGSNFSGAWYPKFAVSWVASEEDFMGGGGGLFSQLRLRGAWGRAGQQPDVFSAIQTYEPVVGFQNTGSVTPQNIGNPDLKPEVGEELEMGFDAGLWNDRLGVEFTYYNKKVKDAILSIPIKPSRGFPGNQFTNIGETKNSGIELAVDFTPVNKESLGLDLRLVYATNETEITDMGGVAPSVTPNAGSFIQQYFVQGYAPGGYWYKRVVSSTITPLDLGAGFEIPVGLAPMCEGGDPIEGAPNLGVANGTVVPCGEAPQLYHGRPTPSWSGSFSANLRLGQRFQVLGVVDYVGGHVVNVGDIAALHHFFWSSQALLEGTSEVLAGRFGTILEGDGGETWGASGMLDAGFAKLRTVAVSYEMPGSMLRWMGVTRGSFTLSGENLAFLWRAQKDIFGVEAVDPEITPNRINNGSGFFTYTQESWPQLMRIRGTLRLTF